MNSNTTSTNTDDMVQAFAGTPSVPALESFVAERLEALRLTPDDLASAMDIRSLQTLSKKLQGLSQLSTKQAKAMAELLETSVEHICTLADKDAGKA